MEIPTELCPGPVVEGSLELATDVCPTVDVLLCPEPYPEVEMAVTLITGGRLDWVGMAKVVSNAFDVVVRIVASGPIVIGTPKMAQSSATTEKVSILGQ